MRDPFEELQWDGVIYMVSVFLISAASAQPAIEFATLAAAPGQVKTYRLDSTEEFSGKFFVYEYDLIYDAVPVDFAISLEQCLDRVSRHGVVAWLGLEGSFSFDQILTSEIASQVYGVCYRSKAPILNLDPEERESPVWQDLVVAHREQLFREE